MHLDVIYKWPLNSSLNVFIFQLKNVRERLAKNLTEKGVLTTEKQVKIKYSTHLVMRSSVTGIIQLLDFS